MTTIPIMDTITPQWTNLPKDLLNIVAKCLRNRNDILHFRAVCSSFRSATPFPPKHLPPHILNSQSKQFLLEESTIYAFEPLNKIPTSQETNHKLWLVRVEELKHGVVRVKDPFTTDNLEKRMSDKLPKSLYKLNYRVQEISKTYRFRHKLLGLSSVLGAKVAVSSAFDEIDDGFVLMVIFSEGQLHVWRNEDKKWANIVADVSRFVPEDPSCDYIQFEFLEIVFHNRKFYLLGYVTCSTGHCLVTLHTVDPKSLRVTQVSVPISVHKHDGRKLDGPKYLVSSFKDLYLINRYHLICNEENPNGGVLFNVFKLDEEEGKWIQVTSGLEDKVFFLGDHSSFSLSAKDYSGCKGNSVYLIDNVFLLSNSEPGSNIGIYNLEDGTFRPISAFPDYSNIFWPPPTWLEQDFQTHC